MLSCQSDDGEVSQDSSTSDATYQGDSGSNFRLSHSCSMQLRLQLSAITDHVPLHATEEWQNLEALARRLMAPQLSLGSRFLRPMLWRLAPCRMQQQSGREKSLVEKTSQKHTSDAQSQGCRKCLGMRAALRVLSPLKPSLAPCLA